MSDRFATVELLARRAEQLAAGDPQATRLVYALVIGLVIVGVVLVLIAIWMLRRTKADMELLGPLERMSDSKWRKSDPAARQALLDDVRPEGAIPPTTTPSPTSAAGVALPPPTLTEPEIVAEPEPVADAEPIVGPEPVIDPGPIAETEPETVVEPEDAPDPEPVDDAAAAETVNER